VETNDSFTADNFFTAAPVPTVQLHYNEMLSVGEEISGIAKNAMPACRLVGYNATASLEEQALRVAEDALKALTDPLTERESIAGLWEFAREPRYIAEGYYEHVRYVMEGDLARCTTTIASAQFTDGSPVTLPTDKSLEAMLAATSRHPDEVIGPIQTSGTPATVKYAAIQGIMAGLKPVHMPVMLALTECMVYTHDFGEQLNGADGWFAYAIAVSGPITQDREIGFNTGGPAGAGPAALTPGVPANTGLGRFMRLVMVNIGGIEPGIMEAKGIGHTAKTGIVVAEANLEAGWPGFSTIIERDPVGRKTGAVNKTRFRGDENTVSLFILWGDMIYSLRNYNSFTNPDVSPGGVVPATRPEWADWLTDEQYAVARVQLQSTIAAGRVLAHHQGLTAFTRVSTARNLNNAGITREMAARFVSEFCTDTNSYAQRHNGLGSMILGATFTLQDENLHSEWNSQWWMPTLGEDPDAKVKYYNNPKLINFVVGPSLTWSPMVMAGLPRWTASIDEWR
jgi:hypothetical protein